MAEGQGQLVLNHPLGLELPMLLCQNFIIIALCFSLESEIVMLPALFFFKITLAIWVFFLGLFVLFIWEVPLEF